MDRNFWFAILLLILLLFTDARAISVGQFGLLLGRRLRHLTLRALERNIGVCDLLLYVMKFHSACLGASCASRLE